MRGISPVIATIILLLITIALAGAAWTYFSGYLGAQIAKDFLIASAFCSDNRILVYITNTGITPLNVSADFVVAMVNNRDVKNDLNKTLVLKSSPGGTIPGETGLVLNTSCDGTCTGTHFIRLVVGSREITRSIVC